MGFSPTAPFSLTTWSLSTSTAAADAYKTAIDNNFVAAQRFVPTFAAHERTPSSNRDMSIDINAGWLFNGNSLVEVASQNTGLLTAPVTNPRIDRIVADMATGLISILTGTEAVTPIVPSRANNVIPIAQIALSVGMTKIGNSMLTDERGGFWGGFVASDYQEFTSTGSFTWNRPSGFSTNAMLLALIWGAGGAGSPGGGALGGGGGGSCLPVAVSLGSLTTSIAVTVGAGSTVGAASGGQSAFGSFVAPGGGSGSITTPGGGGGLLTAGSAGLGGAPLTTVADSDFGGGDPSASSAAGNSFYGGGGGGSSLAPGQSGYGGGGGAGGGGLAGGLSLFGGNGGSTGVAGSAPGGGGGYQAAGARGQVQVWVIGSR